MCGLFSPPFGGLMRWLGGIPVDRRAPQGLVAQVAAEFSRQHTLVLVIPPEGTRKRATHWKSGFYRIALAAGVPIACSFLDYEKKCGGIGLVFVPTGDKHVDIAKLAEFYASITGKYPERFGPVRFEQKPDEPRTDG